jgi:hypothetical protein
MKKMALKQGYQPEESAVPVIGIQEWIRGRLKGRPATGERGAGGSGA